MTYTKFAFTLIEVMVALVVFSLMVGLSSRFISTGMQYSYVNERVEPWLVYMEEVTTAFQAAPKSATLLSLGDHENPFPHLHQPDDFTSLKLELRESEVSGLKIAIFTAVNQHQKEIVWRIYRKTD